MTALLLFILAEERQQRDDERPDVGKVIQPIEELHTRHLLPSRKKADTSNCLPRRMLSYVQKFFKREILEGAMK